MPTIAVATPVGLLRVTAKGGAIAQVSWGGCEGPHEDDPLLREAAGQLRAYFAGELERFDLPLAPHGSAFQRDVYDQMRAIAFGETRTYGELAAALGTAAQPVGQACGSNPIPIIIPCHRVLAASGLGGYSGAGGIETKITLLKLEGGLPYLL